MTGLLRAWRDGDQGLTVDEMAAALEISSKTVLRDWECSRARPNPEVGGGPG